MGGKRVECALCGDPLPARTELAGWSRCSFCRLHDQRRRLIERIAVLDQRLEAAHRAREARRTKGGGRGA